MHAVDLFSIESLFFVSLCNYSGIARHGTDYRNIKFIRHFFCQILENLPGRRHVRGIIMCIDQNSFFHNSALEEEFKKISQQLISRICALPCSFKGMDSAGTKIQSPLKNGIMTCSPNSTPHPSVHNKA